MVNAKMKRAAGAAGFGAIAGAAYALLLPWWGAVAVAAGAAAIVYLWG